MSKYAQHQKGSLGYRISLLAKLQGRILDKRLARLGIHSGQVGYLLEIVIQPGQPQDRLAELVNVDRAAATRSLRSMESAGLVTREINEENKRQKLVYPTEKARESMDDLLYELKAHHESLFEGFSQEEQVLFIKLFDRAIANARKSLTSHI